MAQELVTEDGIAVLPGAYPTVKVQKQNSGLSATGVLVFIGEATAGPDHTLETDISANFYSPDDVAQVLSKYGSGPLVDAFSAASVPAKDEEITGSPAAIYLIKTNVSGKASKAFTSAGFTSYGTLADKSYGEGGNSIYGVVTAVNEVAPTTGTATYIPSPSASTLGLRVNGGAKLSLSIGAKTLPSALVGSITSGASTGLNSLAGVLATGGVDRGVLTALSLTATLAVVATGNSVVITLGVVSAWATTPTVGDTLIIPELIGAATSEYGATEDSCIIGAGSANAGSYVVTAATSNTVTATKLRNNITGAFVAPVNVSAATLGAEGSDILCFSPIAIQAQTGTNRNVLTGLTVNVTGTATTSSLKLTLATGSVWAALPQVGDTVLIPSTAPAAWHASGANGGWYVVTAATTGTAAAASTITMTRLSNGNPASFAATAIAAVTDLQVFRPAVDGLGKALTLFDNGGTDNVSVHFYALSTTPSTWLSTAVSTKLQVSATEQRATLTVSNDATGVSESVTAGGEIALKVAYKGTTATLTITGTTLTTTVVGGNGANLSINLTKFKTLAALASFIKAQTDYVCEVGTAVLGQLPCVKSSKSVLDTGTYSIASEHGELAGRIKRDAYSFFTELTAGSTLVQLGTVTPAQASTGLPEVQSTFFLAGGTLGGSTVAKVLAGIAAGEKLRANGVVALFSRDAADDIADGLTDATSDYLIDDVNAALTTHIIKMSSFKRRRHRQGFVSKQTSFTNAKLAANNIASYRMAMTFQDFKVVDAAGTITQFQPWMGAVLAASMQAAGFYRSILHKGINCTGIVMADGSFSATHDPDLEEAVKNGLLAAMPEETGGFKWSTDQTTYGTDTKFVFNSIQAIYAADVVALTTSQRMEKAFTGSSLADVSASVALSFLKGIMADLKRLKLLVGDDEAPLGFKDAKIAITGNKMECSLTVKLATSIVFIPIKFLVEEVRSAA